MLAKRIPTILPPLSFEEALECTKIHSICAPCPSLSPPTPPSSPPAPPARRITPPPTQGRVLFTHFVRTRRGRGSIPKRDEASLTQHGVLFVDDPQG